MTKDERPQEVADKKESTKGQKDKIRPYRLRADLQEDLRWYWNRLDAEVGVCSNMASIQARLARLTPSEGPTLTARERLAAWREAKREGRARTLKRHRLDEELRQFWQTMHVSDAPPEASQDLRGSPFARKRARRLHATLARLVKLYPAHHYEVVLFRVYGDPSYALVADEISRLVGLVRHETGAEESDADKRRVAALRRSEAEELFSSASEAYAACHKAHMDEEDAVRQRSFAKLLKAG